MKMIKWSNKLWKVSNNYIREYTFIAKSDERSNYAFYLNETSKKPERVYFDKEGKYLIEYRKAYTNEKECWDELIKHMNQQLEMIKEFYEERWGEPK